ncbi:MAG: signal peptidase II, partial [Spirochaetota bacterium]
MKETKETKETAEFPKKYHFRIFFWTLGVVILDQLSKFYIAYNVPLNDFYNPHFTMWNGYLNIIHVRNTAIAFSIGSGLSAGLKTLL